MLDDTKKCSTCGSIFPLTREFYGQQASTGGFRGRCRVCDRDAKARYAENNPDQIQEKWRRQNARRKAAGLPWSQDDVTVIRARLRDRCFYCGVTLFGGGEVDHMTSLAEGGTNEFRNLTLACLPCNRAKGSLDARAYIEWRKSRGEYCRDIFWPTQEDLGDIQQAIETLRLTLECKTDKRPTGAKILAFKRR